MTDQDPWVAVAVIARPHALGGALIIKPLTRSLDEFLDAPLEQVFLRRRGTVTGPRKILELAVHKGLPMIRLEGVEDRTDAEKMRGVEMVIPMADRWELPQGRYYVDDLEGLDVFDADSGERLGFVKKATEGAAHDYLVIRLGSADAEREIYVPLLPSIVITVDTAGKKAVVRLPEGMLEL